MALARLGLATRRPGSNSARWRRANADGGWRFTEWFHGRTLAPQGMAGQSWNAATYLLARRALDGGGSPW
jgi:hypothetical protein